MVINACFELLISIGNGYSWLQIDKNREDAGCHIRDIPRGIPGLILGKPFGFLNGDWMSYLSCPTANHRETHWETVHLTSFNPSYDNQKSIKV